MHVTPEYNEESTGITHCGVLAAFFVKTRNNKPHKDQKLQPGHILLLYLESWFLNCSVV